MKIAILSLLGMAAANDEVTAAAHDEILEAIANVELGL